MKKKTSALAIVLAVFFSILLFPLIFISSIGSSLIFSMESVIAPNREEELYQSFVKNGGTDWVYDLFVNGVEEGLSEALNGSMPEDLGGESINIDLDARELFTKEQVYTVVDDIYHALIKGKTYQFDLSNQKNYIEAKLREYYETTVTAEIKATVEETIESEVQKEYGEGFDALPESEKQELIAKAKEEATKIALEEAEKLYDTEVIATLETEITSLEADLSKEFNSIYEMPEYQELKALETEYGYSLTDRTELCAGVRMAGYIMLGVTAAMLFVLLLSHWFRPSGFFTAGAFTLVIGGLLLGVAKAVQGILLSLVSSELAAEFATEEFPEFIMPMIEEVLGWLPGGFEKVGKFGLMAAVLFILVGILFVIIRRNKAGAEPVSEL